MACQIPSKRSKAAEQLFLALQEQWKGFLRVDPYQDPEALARRAAEVLPATFGSQDAWERWVNHMVLVRGIGPHVCCAWLSSRPDATLGAWLLRHLDAPVAQLRRVAEAWHRLHEV